MMKLVHVRSKVVMLADHMTLIHTIHIHVARQTVSHNTCLHDLHNLSELVHVFSAG